MTLPMLRIKLSNTSFLLNPLAHAILFDQTQTLRAIPDDNHSILRAHETTFMCVILHISYDKQSTEIP